MRAPNGDRVANIRNRENSRGLLLWIEDTGIVTYKVKRGSTKFGVIELQVRMRSLPAQVNAPLLRVALRHRPFDDQIAVRWCSILVAGASRPASPQNPLLIRRFFGGPWSGSKMYRRLADLLLRRLEFFIPSSRKQTLKCAS
jgi:hypothetical protein